MQHGVVGAPSLQASVQQALAGCVLAHSTVPLSRCLQLRPCSGQLMQDDMVHPGHVEASSFT